MVRYSNIQAKRRSKSKKKPKIQNKSARLATSKINRELRILREIKYLQTTQKLLISKVTFLRLVKELINREVGYWGFRSFRIEAKALEAIQEACEMYLVQLYEDSNLLAKHAKRITLKVEDVKLVRRLRGGSDVTNH